MHEGGNSAGGVNSKAKEGLEDVEEEVYSGISWEVKEVDGEEASEGDPAHLDGIVGQGHRQTLGSRYLSIHRSIHSLARDRCNRK